MTKPEPKKPSPPQQRVSPDIVEELKLLAGLNAKPSGFSNVSK
jgi:hypothetical protein